MGQHKHNPNCRLAKEGKLPPKPKPLSKRETERVIMRQLEQNLGFDVLYAAMNSRKCKMGDKP